MNGNKTRYLADRTSQKAHRSIKKHIKWTSRKSARSADRNLTRNYEDLIEPDLELA